jgi:hypothetical protein
MARENELSAAQNELRWHWRDSQEEIRTRFPKERPAQPELGAGWFDEANRCFCVWDGRQWVGVPMD